MSSDFKKGFTFIELLITILIVTIGLAGISSLFVRLVSQSRIVSSKLVAAYLAQEGIELVRNIRDGNWLERVAWDDGISNGDWEIDYNDTGFTPYQAGGRYLKIDGGFYNYESGQNTKFKRRINISKAGSAISVSVEVSWQDPRGSYNVTAFEKLYQWLQ